MRILRFAIGFKFMKMKIEDLEGIRLMAVSGRIDSLSSAELEGAVNEALQDRSRMILDLADTEYISSSGLRVLLAVEKVAKAKNGDIILTSLQPVVRDVFETAGLNQLFSIKKCREDALFALRSQQ